MLRDAWLDRWLPLALAKDRNGKVLEIGCGHGDDTATLAAAGFRVVAFDLSRAAVALAKLRVPGAEIECRDVRDPLPLGEAEADLVVASLSLHYFPWDETLSILQRVHGVLRPAGLLLCRLNATDDHNFGASGHPEIESNYHLVDGEPKRFFDETSVRRAFASGWRLESLEHCVTRKYSKEKAIWEAVLAKDA